MGSCLRGESSWGREAESILEELEASWAASLQWKTNLIENPELRIGWNVGMVVGIRETIIRSTEVCSWIWGCRWDHFHRVWVMKGPTITYCEMVTLKGQLENEILLKEIKITNGQRERSINSDFHSRNESYGSFS